MHTGISRPYHMPMFDCDLSAHNLFVCVQRIITRGAEENVEYGIRMLFKPVVRRVISKICCHFLRNSVKSKIVCKFLPETIYKQFWT